MASISVITPAKPERTRYLERAVQWLAAGEAQPDAHLIGMDYRREGPSLVRNRLVAATDTDWVAFLDDDDIPLRNHLKVYHEAINSNPGADFIYTYCEVVNRGDDWNPNHVFDPESDDLNQLHIPVTVCVRRQLFLDVGGFKQVPHGEDWQFNVDCFQAGAHFLCVPEVTWRYIFHGDNRSLGA